MNISAIQTEHSEFSKKEREREEDRKLGKDGEVEGGLGGVKERKGVNMIKIC